MQEAIQGMMGLQLGLQVLTLGVTVAGFVVLARKLDVIDRKLEMLAGTVAEVKVEVIWLQKVGDIERSARLAACLDDAQWREQTGRMQEIGSLRREFTEAHHAYAMLMRQMAADARSHGHHEVCQSFFHYCALAGVANIRTDWLFDGAEAAVQTQGQVAAVLTAARAQFVEPMRNFEPGALLHLPTTVLPGLKRTTTIIAEDLNRVHSYDLEIEWCRCQGISLKEWGELGREEEAPLLLVRAA